MNQQYTSWDGTARQWNPDAEGFYFVVIRSLPGECDVRNDAGELVGRRTSILFYRDGTTYGVNLAYGNVSRPANTLSELEAIYSELKAAYPEVSDRLECVKAPCAFDSFRVFVPVEVPRV